MYYVHLLTLEKYSRRLVNQELIGSYVLYKNAITAAYSEVGNNTVKNDRGVKFDKWFLITNSQSPVQS